MPERISPRRSSPAAADPADVAELRAVTLEPSPAAGVRPQPLDHGGCGTELLADPQRAGRGELADRSAAYGWRSVTPVGRQRSSGRSHASPGVGYLQQRRGTAGPGAAVSPSAWPSTGLASRGRARGGDLALVDASVRLAPRRRAPGGSAHTHRRTRAARQRSSTAWTRSGLAAPDEDDQITTSMTAAYGRRVAGSRTTRPRRTAAGSVTGSSPMQRTARRTPPTRVRTICRPRVAARPGGCLPGADTTCGFALRERHGRAACHGGRVIGTDDEARRRRASGINVVERRHAMRLPRVRDLRLRSDGFARATVRDGHPRRLRHGCSSVGRSSAAPSEADPRAPERSTA